MRTFPACASWRHAQARALSARLSPLPRDATRFAQAVAILGEDVDAHHAAALAGLDEQAASEAIADLSRVDVLSSQTLLGFVHPLVRAAVYQTLTPLERNAGHSRVPPICSARQTWTRSEWRLICCSCPQTARQRSWPF